MPKRIIPSSEVTVRTSKPQPKEYKIFDGGGLYLLVTPTGGKLWRLKYRFEGKEKLIALGPYPEISLLEARRRRDEARKNITSNIDPDGLRKAQKQAETEEKETFEVIAREWHIKYIPTWAPGHAAKVFRNLERDLFPWIGSSHFSCRQG